jgi:hypothetical protein
MPTSERADPNPHLLLHLREICEILATGLMRLRRHTGEDVARDADTVRERGDNPLRYVGHQSGHAKPRDKEIA